MPEGDTIFRTARRLRASLVGQTVVQAGGRAVDDAEPIVGHTISDVESRGKHLLIHLDSPIVLHSHMGMTGSWHVYRVGEAWRKPARQAVLSLETDAVVGVCFTPKLVEFLTPTQLRRHRYLRRLGPDLLAEKLHVDEILRRLRIHNPTPIGEALMNQTILCGIGNVYKSEVLFLSSIDPFQPIETFGDAELLDVIERTRVLMHENLEGYPRRTRRRGDGGRVWVYGRVGRPCYRCGNAIRLRRQGDLGRTTYWCPACQRPTAPRTSPQPA